MTGLMCAFSRLPALLGEVVERIGQWGRFRSGRAERRPNPGLLARQAVQESRDRGAIGVRCPLSMLSEASHSDQTAPEWKYGGVRIRSRNGTARSTSSARSHLRDGKADRADFGQAAGPRAHHDAEGGVVPPAEVDARMARRAAHMDEERGAPLLVGLQSWARDSGSWSRRRSGRARLRAGSWSSTWRHLMPAKGPRRSVRSPLRGSPDPRERAINLAAASPGGTGSRGLRQARFPGH